MPQPEINVNFDFGPAGADHEFAEMMRRAVRVSRGGNISTSLGAGRLTATPAKASAQPRYRFWGNRQPPDHRDPIRAQIDATDDGTGTAVMRLYDPIDSWGGVWGVSAKEFAEALYSLEPGTALRLHLNSPGGEVFEGLAILNLLRTWNGPTTAVVDGLAASAASVIAMGADRLVMMPNSELMIHDAWGICIGNAADMAALGATLDHLSDNIASAYAGKAGGTAAQWRAAMQAESWYGAEEAVEAKLADSVWSDDDSGTDDSGDDQGDGADEPDAWDLSAFRYQGRRAAPAPKNAKAAPAPPAPSAKAAERSAQHAARDRRNRLHELTVA